MRYGLKKPTDGDNSVAWDFEIKRKGQPVAAFSVYSRMARDSTIAGLEAEEPKPVYKVTGR